MHIILYNNYVTNAIKIKYNKIYNNFAYVYISNTVYKSNSIDSN